MANFMDFLFGKNEKTQQFQRFTPQQRQSLNNLLGQTNQVLPQGLEFLQQILSNDPNIIQQMQAPARRSFQEETIPSIAERFTSMLGEGGQSSNAFGQQLGQAAASLEENLNAQQIGARSQALQQLMQLLGLGLTPQFENAYFPRQSGFLENLAGTAGQGFGSGLGSLGALRLFGGRDIF